MFIFDPVERPGYRTVRLDSAQNTDSPAAVFTGDGRPVPGSVLNRSDPTAGTFPNVYSELETLWQKTILGGVVVETVQLDGGTGGIDPEPGTGGPGGGPVSWATGITGKPSTFAPTIGSSPDEAVAGDDPRLSDPRPPLQGSTVVFDGDSITAGNNGGALDRRGNSFPIRASLASTGRWRYVDSVAVPGERLDTMIGRFDTSVAPLAPTVVHLIAGTNNVSQSQTTTQYRDQLAAYLAKCRGIGARLVLGTLPPRNTTEAQRNATLRYNQVVREFCALNGVDLVDYYAALVDPVTGGFRTGLGNTDNTHPTSRGNVVIGDTCAAALDRMLPTGRTQLAMEAVDGNNLIANPLFQGTFVNSIPQSWTVVGGAHRAGITATLEDDPAVWGKWLRLAFTSAFVSASEVLVATIPAGSVVPGNTYALRGRVRAAGLRNADTGAGATLNIAAVFNGSDTTAYRARALSGTAFDIDEGFFEIRFPTPSDATSMGVQLQLLSNGGPTSPGSVQFAQLGLYNLTAIGGVA